MTGEKEPWTAATWSTSSLTLTNNLRNMKSLLPPLAGRAIGTGTVSVLCFARGVILPVWSNRHGSIIMNCCQREETFGTTYCTVFRLNHLLMDPLQMFPFTIIFKKFSVTVKYLTNQKLLHLHLHKI